MTDSPATFPGKLRIATRGSRLALRQADAVASLVRGAHPELTVEIKIVSTTGDRDVRPFRAIPGKGLFTTEVEREVMEGRADIAVHSAKDLTADIASRGLLVCVPRRASAHDVVIGGEGQSGEQRLGSLPEGAVVGTSSIRRRALVAEARADLEIVDLRGNIDTRLAKVARGDVDVAILAAAGLERLAPEDPISSRPLDPSWWVPAAGQGALAVEARAGSGMEELFAGLSHASTWAEIDCERAFSSRLEGGCTVPVGCLARASEGHLVATGFVGSPDGSTGLRDRVSGPMSEASTLGLELAEAILVAGGEDILDDLRAERTDEDEAGDG